LLPCASRHYHWLLVYVREQVQPVSLAAVNIATTAAAAAGEYPPDSADRTCPCLKSVQND
jgi:hypothetical protein